jgi:hypothetical protein
MRNFNMNIDNFFNRLAANNSRNFKIEELNAQSHNETLREVIRLALDPFTQFYQRKIPEYEFVGEDSEHQTSLEMAIQNLFYLSSREVTGNAAIAHLRAILSGLDADDAKVIERIIKKDLLCGVDVSTANKIWPGLIVEYPCMLCSPFEQKLIDKIKFPAYAQMKMDGMRFNAIVRDGKVEYRSRNGKEINLLGNLDDQFLAMADGGEYVFDGELLVLFPDEMQFADRQTGNGILNKANKGTISVEEASLINASVWDVIPYVLFCESYCATPYSKRFSQLRTMLENVKVKGKRVWNVTSTTVDTIDQAQEIFQEYLALGHEGIILKDGTGAWEDKRAKHQIKFKGELECDLKIVGTEPHKKKPEWLGAIVCESADGIIKVNVGSGFNDEHRKTLKEKDILGKIVAIKYNAKIKNKSGEQSLFLPVFVEIREDKDNADDSQVIQ